MISALRSPAALATLPLVLVTAACAPRPIAKVPPPTPRPPAGVAAATTGTVWASGLNTDGQLGSPADGSVPSLTPVAGVGGRGRLTGVRAVAGGGRHSLALLDGGTVVAWGSNDHGQLGDGTVRDRPLPAPVRAPDGGPGVLDDAVAISADGDFSMALRANGQVVTWGDGADGQRGIGRRPAPRTPTTVLGTSGKHPLDDVAAVSADGRTELALRTNGQVVAWGSNAYGTVGDGTRTSRPLPVPVRGPHGAARLTGVTRIAMGGKHGLALLREGRVVAWGRNDLGQLGDGTRRDRRTPVVVAGVHGNGRLVGVTAVSAADEHNYALLRDGTVVAWGANTAGQLGDGSWRPHTVPVPVVAAHGPLLRGVEQIDAGDAYGVAVLTDGAPLTWGAGGRGQLAAGNKVSRSRPGPLVMTHGDTVRPVLTVGVGERHLLLVLRD
ncbi:RCC1 domain-containing protein [Actinomadura rayongensis]|uniref:Chromosome condensation regulator RCC1 n=1 Tax=Actinomadura rayongensis TaxID=1429076 RepID=A0A6I4W2R9_9ACTN|nr:chromosome condensation regulator RCC1 [Actinomadura rayongensis]MXQ64487.1 chromosome condensation regulator RCC1 [Actinomadura rayongensis]